MGRFGETRSGEAGTLGGENDAEVAKVILAVVAASLEVLLEGLLEDCHADHALKRYGTKCHEYRVRKTEYGVLNWD